MRRFFTLLLPLFVLAGCTQMETPATGTQKDNLSDDDDDADEKKTTKKPTKTTTGDEPSKAPAADPPAQQTPAGPDVTFTATVAEGKAVGFGGASPDGQFFCAGQQWKNVTITVVANGKGLVKSLTFTGTNTEEANTDCTGVTAAPESQHTYTFTNASPVDAPAKLVAAPTNVPQAQLVADVAVHADTGLGRVTIRFESPGTTGWKFTQQFELKKQ
jgi:hypothetical protein